MTDREKAIVMAYTGICMLAGDKLSVFYEYVASIMGRPVYTHEMGTKVVDNLIKEKARPDFIALCADENGLEKQTRWIPVSERLPELNRPLLVTAYHRVYYGHLISESGNYGYPIFRIHGLGDKNRDWVQETMSHEPYSLGRIDAWMYFDIPEPYKASPTSCSTCILDNTDACTRGAGRAVDDEACEDYLASPTGAERTDE